MTMALISHPDCLLHDMGKDHPEQPAQLQVVDDELINSGLNTILKYYSAPCVTREQLLHIYGVAAHIRTLSDD
jgi:acetoin utilization deacetylase AcuC-like enzyme